MGRYNTLKPIRASLCLPVLLLFAGTLLAEVPPCSSAGLFTEIRLKGKTLTSLIDSGASVSVFDSELEDDLGEPVDIATVVTGLQKIERKVYRSPPVEWRGAKLPLGNVLTSDFGGLRRKSGIDIRAYLGMDFLSSRILKMDFEKECWEIVDELPTPGTDERLVSFRLDQVGRPEIELELPGAGATPFLFDTGASQLSGHIDLETLSLLREANAAELVAESSIVDISGRTLKSKAYLVTKPIRLGSRPLENICFDVGLSNSVGMSLLSRFSTVTIDFPKKRIHLTSSSRAGRVDRIDRSGIGLSQVGEQLRVSSVSSGSPGEEAGVRLNDVLTKVDGKSARETGILSVQAVLSGPVIGPLRETPIALTLSRDGETVDVKVPLNVWPKPPKYKRLP